MSRFSLPATRTALVATTTVFISLLAPQASAAHSAPAVKPAATVKPVNRAVSAAAQARIADKLTRRIQAPVLGQNTSGIVLDAHTGRVIWARRTTSPMLPASVTKLATALAALDVLGPDLTVKTRVFQGSTRGRLVLFGGGDALLTSADLGRLADATAARLRADGWSSARVFVDDSLFPGPTMARGWNSGYYPGSVAPVRPLIVDQRETYDTSLHAGGVFARALAARGIKVGAVGRARRPAGAAEVAAVRSRPIRDWVDRMLLVSDNDIAEYLARLTALRTGKPATWASSRAVRARVLARHGVPAGSVNLYDGSGLSRSNRMTSRGVAAILKAGYRHPELAGLLTGLPVAGETGSLRMSRGRFDTWPSRCAAGQLAGKTGYLRGSVTLAGRARTADGGEVVYVLMENGQPSTTSVKRAIDGLAATLTGCW